MHPLSFVIISISLAPWCLSTPLPTASYDGTTTTTNDFITNQKGIPFTEAMLGFKSDSYYEDRLRSKPKGAAFEECSNGAEIPLTTTGSEFGATSSGVMAYQSSSYEKNSGSKVDTMSNIGNNYEGNTSASELSQSNFKYGTQNAGTATYQSNMNGADYQNILNPMRARDESCMDGDLLSGFMPTADTQSILDTMPTSYKSYVGGDSPSGSAITAKPISSGSEFAIREEGITTYKSSTRGKNIDSNMGTTLGSAGNSNNQQPTNFGISTANSKSVSPFGDRTGIYDDCDAGTGSAYSSSYASSKGAGWNNGSAGGNALAFANANSNSSRNKGPSASANAWAYANGNGGSGKGGFEDCSQLNPLPINKYSQNWLSGSWMLYMVTAAKDQIQLDTVGCTDQYFCESCSSVKIVILGNGQCLTKTVIGTDGQRIIYVEEEMVLQDENVHIYKSDVKHVNKVIDIKKPILTPSEDYGSLVKKLTSSSYALLALEIDEFLVFRFCDTKSIFVLLAEDIYNRGVQRDMFHKINVALYNNKIDNRWMVHLSKPFPINTCKLQ